MYICIAINNGNITTIIQKMKVDPREILFIRDKAPKGMIRTLADNIGMEYSQVRTEIYTLKDDYTDALVIEARRLLLAMSGIEYKPELLESI